jgi:hypothetical protein
MNKSYLFHLVILIGMSLPKIVANVNNKHSNDMKEKQLELLEKVKNGTLTPKQAQTELLGLFSVSGSAIDILIWLADCYYTIDEATVPKGGIDVAPQQVVGNISLNYKSYKQLRDIAEHYR